MKKKYITDDTFNMLDILINIFDIKKKNLIELDHIIRYAAKVFPVSLLVTRIMFNVC